MYENIRIMIHNDLENEEFNEKEYWEDIKYETWLDSIGGVKNLGDFIMQDFIKIKKVYDLVENKGVGILEKKNLTR